MSERNGEKSRFQINRKRAIHRRARIRELIAAASAGDKRTAKAPAKPPRGAKS
jgi:hypothetical protein